MIQMVPMEHFRVSHGLANQSFCRSDILRAQLRSSLKVGKKFLASDSKTVCNSRQLIFSNGWFVRCIISKELTLKEFLEDNMLH